MTSSAVHVRDALDRDREAILAVLLDAYGQYEGTMPGERWAEYKRNIAASVDEPGPFARLVAEHDGELVGSAVLFPSSLAAYGRELGIEAPIIRLIAVKPAARGRGVATALIRESARRARELGARTLHLHTSDLMASAVRLYERLGFERAYDKDLYNGDILVKSYRLHLDDASLLKI
ncbi:GNAT family N-acetyltransferase [Cohnella sp. 56]|uniref:GNAT family N-acetyltransferase n=1 Tax=Cohnella sp. 56 TaxID=3113722 RepID=UPI0030E832EB